MTPLESLIETLEQEPLENLGEEFLRELQARLPEEPRLRQVLAERLHLEGALYASLNEGRVDVRRLLQRFRRRRRARSAWWMFSGGVAMLLVAATVSFLTAPNRKRDVVAPARLDPVADAPIAPELAERHRPDPASNDRRPERQIPPGAADVGGVADAARPANIARVPSAAVVAATAAAPMPDREPMPQPVEAAPASPFDRWLSDDAPQLSPDAAAVVAAKTMAESGMNSDEASLWWSELPGKPHAWHDERRGDRNFVRFEGWSELVPEWRPDAVLRLEAFDIENLSLYAWIGEETIRFRMDRHRQPNVIVCERLMGDMPDQWDVADRLLATDGGRFHHGEPGLIELRWQDGQLLLAQRQQPLLSVPAEAPPDNVWLQGKFRLASCFVYRRDDTAIAWPEEHDEVALPASSYPWQQAEPVASAALFHDDQRVRLQRAGKEDAVVWIDQPQRGFWQADLVLADAAVGTGICLSNDDGEIPYVVAVRKERKTGRSVFQPVGFRDRSPELPLGESDLLQRVGVRDRHLRITCGCGLVRLATRTPGGMWGTVDERIMHVDGRQPTRLGLFVWNQASPGAAIELRSIAFRNITPFSQDKEESVDSELAELLKDVTTYEDWLATVLAEADIAPSRGDLLAAIERSVFHVRHRGLRRELLDRWLAAQRPTDWSAYCSLVGELAPLCDLSSSRESDAFFAAVERQASAALHAGEKQVFARLTMALAQAALATESHPVGLRMQVAQQEMLREFSERQWERLAPVIAQTHRLADPVAPDRRWPHRWDNQERLTEELAEFVDVPEVEAAARARTRGPSLGRSPLLAIPNKDVFNLAADLSVAVENGNPAEAARRIAATHRTAASGLANSPDDPDLWQSLAVIVDAALAEDPAIRRRFRDDYDAESRIVVGNLISRGDVEGIRHAAVVYPGTPGAAEAHRWLGDRSMALADYRAAWNHYRRASTDDTDHRASLAARLSGLATDDDRVEWSVAGIAVDDAALSESVDPPSKQSANDQSSPLADDWDNARIPVLRMDWEFHEFETIPDAFRELERDDRAAAGLATTQHGAITLVTGLNSVQAVDTAEGRRLWSRQWTGPTGRYAGAQRALPAIVWQQTTYVTLQTSETTMLAALDLATGSPKWTYEQEPRPASEPFVVDGRVCFFGTRAVGQTAVEMTLTRLDPADGSVVRSHDLGQIRNPVSDVPVLTGAAVGRFGYLAAFPGTLVCLDASARVRWIRQFSAVPYALSPCGPMRPLLIVDANGDRLVAALPGRPGIDGIDLRTGRLLWQRWMPDRFDAVAAGESVVVAGEATLAAVDPRDGTVVWQRFCDRPLVAITIDSDRVQAVCRSRSDGRRPSRYRLVALDLSSGRREAERLIEMADKEHHVLGFWHPEHASPRLIIGSGETGSRWGVTPRLPQWSSVPVGGEPDPDEQFLWQDITNDDVTVPLERLLGGWTLINSRRVDVDVQTIADRESVVLRPQHDRPLVFIRFGLPKGDRRSKDENGAALAAGVQPKEQWVLRREALMQSARLELDGREQTGVSWSEIPAIDDSPEGRQLLILTGTDPKRPTYLLSMPAQTPTP